MAECGKCGVSIKRPRRTQTGTHFGKPIYRTLCRKCRKEAREENEERNNRQS